MANSQNGWPVDRNGAMQDRAPLIRNVTVPNGVRAGDVAVVFRWLAREYDRRVERLVPGWCWGWFVKNIEGSSVISNHASGTAVDFNAPDNPMGSGTTRKSMTQSQIDECHALERESGGVLRWGGDFSRNDPMHWEIVGSTGETKRFADKIRNALNPPKEPDVPTDQEDLAAKIKLNDAETGGGQLSSFGNSVLGHGYPRRPNESRQAAWRNLQNLQVDIDTLKDGQEDLAGAVEELGTKVDQILALLAPAEEPPAPE